MMTCSQIILLWCRHTYHKTCTWIPNFLMYLAINHTLTVGRIRKSHVFMDKLSGNRFCFLDIKFLLRYICSWQMDCYNLNISHFIGAFKADYRALQSTGNARVGIQKNCYLISNKYKAMALLEFSLEVAFIVCSVMYGNTQ